MKSIPEIKPTQVFSIATLTELLSLKSGTVPRELRLRRLRFAKRAGKVLILGEWILQWLRDGEIHKANTEVNGAAAASSRRAT
jgi:hypothetical protein